MVRTPCCDKTGLKKGAWTPEEDRKLMAYVTRYGCWNWRQLPKFAGKRGSEKGLMSSIYDKLGSHETLKVLHFSDALLVL